MKLQRTVVLAVANHKGGSGKTSVAGGLIYTFAKMGYKVLGIDGDTQMNLTRSFNFNRNPKANLMSAINDEKSIKECILSGCIINTRLENIDFILADHEMASAEMVLFTKIERERVIRKKLQDVVSQTQEEDGYDFIVFDTNPNLGLLNFNILVASDEVIIPVELSIFGIEGLEVLLGFCKEVRQVNPDLNIAGVVLNKVDARKSITHDAIKVIENIFGDIIFETQIRTDTKVEQAQWEKLPLHEFNEKSRANQEIQELAKEVLKVVQTRQ